MLNRILKTGLAGAVVLILVGGVFYALGLRVLLDGGGSPYLRFVPSERAQAEQIARHREMQRQAAQSAALPVEAESPSPSPSEKAGTETGEAVSMPALAEKAETKPAESEYWTDFRGPDRDGHYRQRPILTNWPQRGLEPIWKQPVGGGYASFAVARQRVFTIEQRGSEEVVAAYDLNTGRELWINGWRAAFRERMGGDGPRATPVWSEGRVYALGGTGELRCLMEDTGEVIWRTNILEDAGARNLQWGMAASPLIVDETVIVLPGGSDGRSVVAYARRTGEIVWTALDDQQSYSSPMLATLAGVRQILVFSALRLAGLSPESGELLWEYPWRTQFDVNASQPLIVGEDRIFLSTGYGSGAAVIELSREGDGFDVREVWRNIRMKNQFTSSVLHDGFIYGLDESILACIDAATGELQWKGGRYGYGQVMLADGHLIVLTEDGNLVLVRATPERHEELVRFPVLEGKTWNHPAISDGILLVRNLAEMAAFDLRLGPNANAQKGS